ncbi:hypothetical protein RY280_23400 [Bacillus paralicheniformis]|uniref:hypothetical protein n=1 Tax=Bacillus paralicheniformis TaxID=1648923 RepID=UPI003A89B82D
MEKRYRVIKDIPEGWETGAKIDDILIVKPWWGELTLMKGNKAVCDVDSATCLDHCVEIKTVK